MDAASFVRTYTTPQPVPLVPSICVYTATELTPLWQATEDVLRATGVAVPFWCVPWAGGQAVARYVLDHPELVRGKRVVDFGTGSGLVAIAAAKAGAAHVVGVDIDRFAIAACNANASLNDVTVEAVEVDLTGATGIPFDADVLLAGDVWYEREPAARFDAWLRGLAQRGVVVITGDPGRSYVPPDLTELARFDVPTTRELEGATHKTTRVLRYA